MPLILIKTSPVSSPAIVTLIAAFWPMKTSSVGTTTLSILLACFTTLNVDEMLRELYFSVSAEVISIEYSPASNPLSKLIIPSINS